ncbi:MAG TPA: preprotein translocase subunit YajC [Stackebrandtia sp.]|uniref:preprotein translocase subunit YajC n=1 Tax=Stackebrandtia sp. TaxID=2023065 RepID=UPI002D594DB8|nr:preprotein translocase subunit YajC [Stackebrandtia sp.]HZE41753.1 preprotein translocase subunit YajC [Stackebrandtia sp.]
MLLLADKAPVLAAKGSSLSGLVMPGIIILLMVAMYFFMIRPQNKKRREMMEKQRQSGPGDTIVTIGGLHATIIDADDSTVTLEVAPGVMCVYERAAVARVISDDEPTTVDSTASEASEDSEPADDEEQVPASAVVDLKADKKSATDGTQN